MNGHHHAAIRFEHLDFRFDGQHGAYLGPVADRVPKVLAKMFHFGWCKSNRREGTVFAFLDTKQDDAAVGVGKGGVRLPHAAWETALRGFHLDPVNNLHSLQGQLTAS